MTKPRACAGSRAALLLLLGVLASGWPVGGAGAGPSVDALDGRWTATDCSDPGTGTWSVFGNQIQFFWPLDSASNALEVVVREEPDVVETEVLSPDTHKGRRFRYSIVGDDVLIDSLSDGRQQIVHRCTNQ